MPPNNGLRPIHPGEILAEELEEMGLSADECDEALAVPAGTVAAILEKRLSIDAELALRLSRYLGAGERLWMNLQVSYDLKVAERGFGHLINKQVQPRQDTPTVSDDWDSP